MLIRKVEIQELWSWYIWILDDFVILELLLSTTYIEKSKCGRKGVDGEPVDLLCRPRLGLFEPGENAPETILEASGDSGFVLAFQKQDPLRLSKNRCYE